jgi:hypothetical protein
MSGERFQHMGRLREQELKAKELQMRIKVIIEQLRLKLDPFEDVESLEVELIQTLSIELARLQIEYRGLLEQNKAIKKALGKD